MIRIYGEDAKKVKDTDVLTVSKGPNGINIFSKDGKELFRTFQGKNELKTGDQLGVVLDSVEGRQIAKLCTFSEYPQYADQRQVELFKSALIDAGRNPN